MTSSEALDLIETCACTRRVLDKGQITCLECGTIYGSLKQVYFANVVGRLKGGIHEYDE